ncbi:MAG: hypothetical protein HY294_04640 [Candidatus Rokubacteria bacterium]|nr:hypothetical protein [Candidatus Rokubacteria bacterium]
MSLTTKIFKRLHALADRHTGLGQAMWHEIANRTATARQRRAPLPAHDALSTRALEALRRDGLATFHVSELEGGAALFDAVCREETAILGQEPDTIERGRARLRAGGEGHKEYVLRFVPGSPSGFTFDDPSVCLALHGQILGVVDAFLGLYAELRALEFWYTLADRQQTPRQSQLWHRDFEDVALVKVFLYTSDVDETAGPFSFVLGTHAGELRWADPDAIARRLTNRADDRTMERVVPRDRWFTGTGRAGTIIMAATKGYHKGGFATEKDRRLLHATYLSPWSRDCLLPKPVRGVPATAHPAIHFAAGDRRAGG